MVVFPGGFGTFDELFEMLMLAQTGKLERRIPILLFGSAYWREIINFDALVRQGMIAQADLDLFVWVDDPAEALRVLQRSLPVAVDAESPAFAKSRTTRRSP